MELGLISIDEWMFGKHKGKKIEEIPTDYLIWVVYDTDIGGVALKMAIKELDKREEMLKGGLGQALKKNYGVSQQEMTGDEW